MSTPPSSPPPASPYQMKEQDANGKKLTPTVKAYQNLGFLNSHDARIIRILCEFQEPAQRLREQQVNGTILFFGSARSMSRGQFQQTMATLQEQLAKAVGPQQAELQAKVDSFKKVQWMCPYVDTVEVLARKLTEWAMNNDDLDRVCGAHVNHLTGEPEPAEKSSGEQPLLVTTGGGPGIMEAANKGAASVPGAKTMGMGISLPFEKGLNPYVSKNLAFEFHYFFTRKFWMMYSVRALIIGPGGFGTMDELFELLTLRQTGKVPDLPIVLLGKQYWQTIINWQAMADFGTISQKEVDNLFFSDDADEAFVHVTKKLLAMAGCSTSP